MAKRKNTDPESCSKRPRLYLTDEELLQAVEDIENLNNSQINLDLVEACNLQSQLNNQVEDGEFNSQVDCEIVEACNLQSYFNDADQTGGGGEQILPGHTSTELNPQPSTSSNSVESDSSKDKNIDQRTIATDREYIINYNYYYNQSVSYRFTLVCLVFIFRC